MAKGQIAKDLVTQKICEAFAGKVAGIADKKIYVWAEENGEAVQVAISLTCPKVPLGENGGNHEWGSASEKTVNSTLDLAASVVQTPTEISDEDKAKVDALMKALNIF